MVCPLRQARAFQPDITGDVSVITRLLGYDRGVTAYVQSFGLKAVAVVLYRLENLRSPEWTALVTFFIGESAMLRRLDTGTIIKNCLIIILWPLGALMLSVMLVQITDSVFDDGHLPSHYSLPISQIGMALMIAGFIVIYAKFKIKKIYAFLLMALPPAFLLLSGVPFSGLLCPTLPLFLWWAVKKKERDELAGLLGILEKKKARVVISLYAGWFCILMLTNNFQFEDILDFGYYDFDQTRWMMLGPPLLAFGGFLLFRWCQKGKA